MTSAPQGLRALKNERRLEVVWQPEAVGSISFWQLRCACPCAQCVDEHTGKKLLRDETVPSEIVPTQMAFSGNYALKITWSDGHSTGLFTWDHLAALAPPGRAAITS